MKSLKNNPLIHTIALSLTKTGDGILNPKLVLAWLLTTLGASSSFIGFLVPIREAGALLPQLFTARKLQEVTVRKWWWIFGSILQGAMVLAITITALTTTSSTTGILILIFLGIFALARSICSISYKDVLGKTVEKTKRGIVTGTASSIAAAGILIFGLLLFFGVFDRFYITIIALFIASGLWWLAATVFSFLHETPSEISTEKTEASLFSTYKAYLQKDKELQKFILARALLTATAVAPPFLILLSDATSGSIIEKLGGLILASSLASLVSGRIWGKLSDKSTPAVLALSGVSAAIILAIAFIAVQTSLYATIWFLPAILFVLMVSYQGVRIARSVHLVNIAHENTRAAYAAISNTIIGIVLLGTGLFGFIAETTNVQVVIGILALMSLTGALFSTQLKNPQ
jgi:hypothetical protein